jgi:hypothetical protein
LWRPGQEDNVAVHYVVYRGTMEEKAAELVGKKLAASLALTGDTVEGALIQQNDDGRGFLSELAKRALSGAAVDDLQAIFQRINKLARERMQAKSQYIGGHVTDGKIVIPADSETPALTPVLTPAPAVPVLTPVLTLSKPQNFFDAPPPAPPVLPPAPALPVADVTTGAKEAAEDLAPASAAPRVLKQLSFF